MISPGRLWWLFRRDLKRGWSAAYHDYKTLPLIEHWAWPFWGERPHHIPIHVLTGENEWLMAAWMLASWFHYTEMAWPVVIHDDGTLSPETYAAFRRIFAHVRIISRGEADTEMNHTLQAFPFCHDFRNMHPLALKILDTAHFATSDRYLLFDSDLLFFNHPREIVDWANNGAAECWFNEDIQESSLVTAAEAREELGVKLWSRVNSGLCMIWRPAISYDFCDRCLAETSILKGHIWRIEQTLFALCASRHGRGGLLPKTYEVSLKRNAAAGAISRHYVGAVRERFFAEGLKRLEDVLLAPEEGT